MTNYYQQLHDKLTNHTAVIGVVGLGYVGLPLSVEKAKAGYTVIGFDVQQSKVELVNKGVNYIGDVVDEDLKVIVASGKFKASADFSELANVDAVAICVPTPLDIYQQPDTSYVESSAREIANYAKKGTLVVLESTTYPGTTEEIICKELESKGFVVGEDIFVAYSPERIDPGNKSFNTKNTPKVVGGITEKCTEVAALLYSSVLEGEVHKVSSPAVAEMEKIFENTFRHINIALANEMAILCEKMGIDVWEVIDAAKTKPYGFMAFYPGPGLGGHCIPIDPFYLTWKAREYNYHTRLIELAGEINNAMPDYVITRAMQILNEDGIALRGANVVLLGIAYKKDIDDMRESPSLKLVELLKHHGASITSVDPHVSAFKVNKEQFETEPLTEEILDNADLVILATDHSDFDYELIAQRAKVIFDTRNAFKGIDKPNRYIKL
ncbi:nucleotide sugar dehydrogenase [Chryseomicrobium aureum]|uniref:nucleotide sugar dehydrogenase n=1 Tax=Chryseomicrobium aureum TaxID=1441723 RepID=UPI00370D6E39